MCAPLQDWQVGYVLVAVPANPATATITNAAATPRRFL